MESISVTGLTNDYPPSQYRRALETKEELSRLSEEYSNIELDLSEVKWFCPMYLAPVSVAISQMESEGTSVQVVPPDRNYPRVYISQIDFPEGSSRPSEEYDNHLPLCLINTESGEKTMDVAGDKIGEILGRFFSGQPKRRNGVMYPIWEIVDNVEEHSLCDFGALLVQHYPNKECVDICIADDGVSIPGNYEGYGIDFEDDTDALRKALTMSISTKPDEGYDRGFGLRTTAELVCDGLDGEVMLSSRNATIRRDRNREPLPVTDGHSWSGTVFAARLNLPDENFNITNYVG